MQLKHNGRSDVLTVVMPQGTEIEVELTPEQMCDLSVWAFCRKTVHIINGVRRIEPFTPITQGPERA